MITSYQDHQNQLESGAKDHRSYHLELSQSSIMEGKSALALQTALESSNNGRNQTTQPSASSTSSGLKESDLSHGIDLSDRLEKSSEEHPGIQEHHQKLFPYTGNPNPLLLHHLFSKFSLMLAIHRAAYTIPEARLNKQLTRSSFHTPNILIGRCTCLKSIAHSSLVQSSSGAPWIPT
eukprot:maker-scaffold632_size121914-snap-gene-0.26 protein:Tk02605 transcript:maker-scaffold632_size121914-snap-gene-0.26-mRNA-1 annotation:"lytic transglycosylase"